VNEILQFGKGLVIMDSMNYFLIWSPVLPISEYQKVFLNEKL